MQGLVYIMAEYKTGQNFQKYKIAVIIPAYKVEREIEAVLASVPDYIQVVIVVNDASPDSTAGIVAKIAAKDKRILLLNHAHNQGVGGAMVTGFMKALELQAQVIVKLDGDGQMNPDFIPPLIAPLIQGKAAYTKGNRFHDFQSLRKMPLVRHIGNVCLSFLAKAATGYWNCFDPTNGFIAIRGDMLSQLPLAKIDHGFFFETSMLSNLYLENAYILDIPIPALYGQEKSNLSIYRTLIQFPAKLVFIFFRRILLKHFLYDFSMISIYLLAAIPMLLFGLIFGIAEWMRFARLGTPATTGTVMLATLPIILGIQILLSAIGIDLQAVPKESLHSRPLDNI
jgi:dolichol-phosphate mannosyltransferase